MEIRTFPPPDDPGWYDALVWDCTSCGCGKIHPECAQCPACLADQPEDSVYMGRCWGYVIETNPAISLAEVKLRRFTMREDESVTDDTSVDDAAFLAALKQDPST